MTEVKHKYKMGPQPTSSTTPGRRKPSNGAGVGNGKKIRGSPSGLRDFEVGTRVEAKDFSGQWFAAQISEVDLDEREILIHFTNKEPKEEWMPMDSSRIRPLKEQPRLLDAPIVHLTNLHPSRLTGMKGHYFPVPKQVDGRFKVGEEVMAAWTNNLKYPATIINVHPNDRYDVIFDDGYRKSVRGSKISRMKESDQEVAKQRRQILQQQHILKLQQKGLAVPPHLQMQNNTMIIKSNASNGNNAVGIHGAQFQNNKSLQQIPSSQLAALPAPYSAMPSAAAAASPIVDGLLPVDENIGTKEDRRERKRKLNVKELFSTKRPRGAEKVPARARVDKKSAVGGSGVLSAAVGSLGQIPPVHSSNNVPSQNGLLMGLDPMFSANPIKVEGGYLPTSAQDHSSTYDGSSLDGQSAKAKQKKKKFKKKQKDGAMFGNGEDSDGKMARHSLREDECSIQWNNGEPQGEPAYVVESAVGPRKSIIVEDRRLPEGWGKHAIRRQGGTSAGKWDVFLVSPKDGRKFRSRNELRQYHLERGLKFQADRFDFSLGRKKVFRQKGAAATNEPAYEDSKQNSSGSSPGLDGDSGSHSMHSLSNGHTSHPSSSSTGIHPPAPHSIAPQVTPLGVQRVKTLLPRVRTSSSTTRVVSPPPPHLVGSQLLAHTPPLVDLQAKKSISGRDGYDCPKDGCGKRFRNENLLQMHMKHYHPEYMALMGSTPNVADLAYARTVGEPVAEMPSRNRGHHSTFMEKIERISRIEAHRKAAGDGGVEPTGDSSSSLESRSPTLGLLLKKGPMRKDSVDGTTAAAQAAAAWMVETAGECSSTMPSLLEMRLLPDGSRDSKLAQFSPGSAGLDSSISRPASRTAGFSSEFGSDQETTGDRMSISPWRSSGLMPGMADSASSSPITTQTPSYFYSKKKSPASDKRVGKISDGKSTMPPTEQLRREELINCTCGFTEEDGLMIQCDLCLCWQHGLCNKIENEDEVPDKYVCQICINPLRERKSRHYIHDQDWLKEGALPSLSFTKRDREAQVKREEALKRSHDLCAVLLQMQKVIHSLRVKVHIAEQKDHPKLYLWANSWVNGSNSCPTPPSSPAMPGEGLDLKLESGVVRRGKSLLQEALLNGRPTQQHQQLNKSASVAAPRVPQPEAPIDPVECRLKLLDHIENYQSMIDSRLNSLEQQITELEKDDTTLVEEKPSPDFFIKPMTVKKDADEVEGSVEESTEMPQVKETIQMLLRDLRIMRKISVI